jgi:hypothetical protein
MRVLRDINEAEMVAIFLKGEISSKRFGHRILSHLNEGLENRKIIDSPDLSNEAENVSRSTLLGKHRGYGNSEGLFRNFPKTVTWKEVLLTKEELKNLRFINYDYWVELSSGTRSPEVAAENIKKGIEIFDRSNERFFKAVDYIKSGGTFEPIILVAKDPKSKIVILEGHLRLTSYFLTPEHIQPETKCIIGYSPNFSKWGLY